MYIDVRRFIALLLLWSGRALLLGAPVYALVCRYVFKGWPGVPRDDGAVMPASYDALILMGFILGAVFLLLVLPIGSGSLATVQGSVLWVRTVSGPKSVALDGARVSIWALPGRGWGTLMTSVRQGWRWVVVAESGFWDRPPALRLMPGAPVTWLSWVKGVGFIVVSVVSAFIGMIVMLLLAGDSLE
ncbi:hypothetical protein ACQCX5_09250 [Propionibacteriaceae bacterium G57]|uniref:hypothetical protein n=1 Tax=Aestuariimicrobium sp. G57 TaxID=3418485 RepID=UPI003DA7489F